MKTQLLRAVLPAFLCLLAIKYSEADTFTRLNGEVIEGTIDYVNEKEVSFEIQDGTHVVLPVSELDESSRTAVNTWAEAHPELNGVYASWDVKPSVVRSRTAVTPPQLNSPGFKGLVSLQVILDERGKVSHAMVNKSTHGDLEEAALEAIRKWSFKPAAIAGKAVKARIAISFKFEA